MAIDAEQCPNGRFIVPTPPHTLKEKGTFENKPGWKLKSMMTGLERMLKESLAQAELLLRNNQVAHSQTLQQSTAGNWRPSRTHPSPEAEQTALTGQLTSLTAAYESLQSLLTRLNALLPGK